ncbi:isopenicillin N synthase family dioxygenase [Xanthovirga aplysinae]|uniref:isopenicillin N synthase family dioxygenase n=1 Tax=Xanthovirga aplysinae TaxID=2529853 RepID=UPI0012BCFDAE|nr:2-oxoglutarate and iron-dependent oxygenase domain-containing protein [Xanthovirga aplysinae]MTI33214.1 isopenicillin N synthase family oxygenase [Xanthovirga aplysinae]
MSNVTIATVDFNDFISSDAERKASFIQKLGDSFAEMGFVIVKNHGVSKELREDLFRVSKSFFELEEAFKRNYEKKELNGQRGYISKNRETAKGFQTPDLKEFFHVGQIVEDNDPIKEEYPDNIWPSEVKDMQEVTTQVYKTFENTGKHLLRAIALYLDLDEKYFDDKIHNGNSILRLLHYYPLSNVENIPDDAVRAAAHEDINLITLLMGGSAEGLQAKSKDGQWVSVSPNENEIVINIGDMLQRLTNNRLRSTTHRVVNPGKEKLGTSRYSTPFFLHPRSDMDLSCLESCIDADNPKHYEDITAGGYLDERLIELGLKK